ncbi:MAG: hydroxypyruvate isomerase [Planctomycetota bacterium]|jgi:hydroxypyruvate isomerase
MGLLARWIATVEKSEPSLSHRENSYTSRPHSPQHSGIRMMHRRSILTAGLAGAALPLVGHTAHALSTQESDVAPFQLKYAPHLGMFRQHAGGDAVAQLEFMADQGFRAFEDNGMAGRSNEEQERMAKAMNRLGMEMGVFVCNFGTAFGKQSFTSGKQEFLDNFKADLEKSIECAKRVNATWMTVVLGDRKPNLRQGYQDAHAIEMLRRGAELLEPHDLVMVMEPLNFRDHAGMYLEHSDHAYMLAKAVDSPAVKILFDIYHQSIAEGNLIPNIDLCWDEIAYFQIGDNPGRNEPTTGDVNYKNIFKHIHSHGWQGILGMEHGNSKSGKEGEQAVIDAYRETDAF